MDRRQFLGRVAGAAGAALGSGGNWAVAAGDDASWSLPVLGDLHIDHLDHHDFAWLAREHAGDKSQIENYSRNTREVTPQLLSAVCDCLAKTKTPTPFVLQLGDLIEGLCGNEKLARKQADDAIAIISDTKFPVPFLFTKGNHDVTGPGATEVYDRVLVPFMASTADEQIRKAVFTQQRGGTLMVFFDAYHPDSLEWLEGVMARQKPDRLLFVIHPPVVPYNARSTWHVFSHAKQRDKRERLLNLLGDSHAIVLCGHLHKYCHLVRRTERGRFTQLAISSVALADNKPRDVREGVMAYGPDLVELEPKHSPDTLVARRQQLADEQPFIEHFDYANAWGHAMLTIAGRDVNAEIYRGLNTPWKSLTLGV
jgi:hypothetical protein